MYDPASAVTGLEAVEAAQPEHVGLLALKGLAIDAKFDRDETARRSAQDDNFVLWDARSETNNGKTKQIPFGNDNKGDD